MLVDYFKKNSESLLRLKDVLLLLLILFDLAFIVVITIYDVTPDDLYFMAVFDLVVCIILFINLIGLYYHSEDSLGQFIKSHLIDFISIIPFNFIFFRYLAIFRIFRILQILNVIKVFNFTTFDNDSFRYLVRNQLLKLITIILFLYMIISSIVLYFVDESFTSLFDAFWYNIVTVTAVGYGDLTPITTSGKLIGILTIIVGVLFISVFTAAMSGLYMRKPETETREILKEKIGNLEKDNDRLNKQIDEMQEKLDEINGKLDKITK